MGDPFGLGGGERGLERRRDLVGNIVLHREQIGELPVVLFRPERLARAHLGELHGDADPVAGQAHAAIDHRPHAQVAGHTLKPVPRGVVLRRSRPTQDPQGGDPGELDGDPLGHPGAEVLLSGILGDVAEREDRHHPEIVARLSFIRAAAVPQATHPEHRQRDRQAGGGKEASAAPAALTRSAGPADAVSAAAKAATVSNRSAGDSASPRPTARSTAAGTPGRVARRLRTCSVISRATMA